MPSNKKILIPLLFISGLLFKENVTNMSNLFQVDLNKKTSSFMTELTKEMFGYQSNRKVLSLQLLVFTE